MKITLLTGCVDPHYQLDLLSGLALQNIKIDFIGSDEMWNPEILKYNNVAFYNLRGSQKTDVPTLHKIVRLFKYYFKLIKYVTTTDSKIFHIQWPNKFVYLDRTILNIYYKSLGKKLIYTAHNVNAGERDCNDTWLNRITLKFMYSIVDHIIVHTNKMKNQLIESFNINEKKVSVIPFGINNIIPKSGMNQEQARFKLNLNKNDKILLFFGNIVPYKGLEYALLSLATLKNKFRNIKLIIAGRVFKESNDYWQANQKIIHENKLNDYIIEKIEFIDDKDIELYCMSSDAMLLPYTYIFQSGILFVSYGFGLPVIAADVGSLKEDIIEGETGFICQPKNPEDLAKTIERYFESELYKNLENNRKKILEYAQEKYSWEKIGAKTYDVYKEL